MNILLVDDDKATRDSVSLFIEQLGHDVVSVGTGIEAIEKYKQENFQLVITDIQMPKMDGFTLMREIKSLDRPLVDIVIITGHSNIDNTITALREGAYDYMQKPVNIDELAIIIDRVSEHLSLKMTNERLTARFEETVKERVSETETQLEDVKRAFRETVGLKHVSVHSKKLEECFMLAGKFHESPTVPVLIEGETGTGKEIMAKYVHYGPQIVTTPLVAINCAAIPADLFESELFGHEPGAFTGSGTTSKKGKLELAEDGTILLDEIGDMPLSMQVKLLRVLEEREFYRVGGVKKIPFRARVIASTNKSLATEVQEGKFRSDLYHRLNVGYIKIPPLRERKEEIIPLVYDFLDIAQQRHGKTSFKGISPQAETFLKNLEWTGNIRQLQNAVERVVLLYDGPFVEREHLSFLEEHHAETPQSADENKIILNGQTRCVIPEEGIDLDELINTLIEEAMNMSYNNKTLAAKLLNISPRTISRRLEKLSDESD